MNSLEFNDEFTSKVDNAMLTNSNRRIASIFFYRAKVVLSMQNTNFKNVFTLNVSNSFEL